MTTQVIQALMISVSLSVLLVIVEVSRESTFSRVTLFSAPTFIYFLLIAFGNIFSTLTASISLGDLNPQVVPQNILTTEILESSIFLAFIGVFGFQAIIRNINLTFSDNEFLTINNWISKAKDIAVAHAVEADVIYQEQRATRLAQQLSDLPDSDLNAHVLNLLGPDELANLESAAKEAAADPKLIKALAIAKANYSSAEAILTSRENTVHTAS